MNILGQDRLHSSYLTVFTSRCSYRLLPRQDKLSKAYQSEIRTSVNLSCNWAVTPPTVTDIGAFNVSPHQSSHCRLSAELRRPLLQPPHPIRFQLVPAPVHISALPTRV